MKTFLLSIVCLALFVGCARDLVPRTIIKVYEGTNLIAYAESPKNYEATNIVFIKSATTNFLYIGGMRAKMDPTIVQMSGEVFNNALGQAFEFGKQAGTMIGTGGIK